MRDNAARSGVRLMVRLALACLLAACSRGQAGGGEGEAVLPAIPREKVISGDDIMPLVFRLRNSESLAPAEERYADKLMRKHNLSPRQLADFLEAIHFRAMALEYDDRVQRALASADNADLARFLPPPPPPLWQSILLFLVGGMVVLLAEHAILGLVRRLALRRRLALMAEEDLSIRPGQGPERDG